MLMKTGYAKCSIMENGNLQQCFRNTGYYSLAEDGNYAKLIRLFINNMKIANCDSYEINAG